MTASLKDLTFGFTQLVSFGCLMATKKNPILKNTTKLLFVTVLVIIPTFLHKYKYYNLFFICRCNAHTNSATVDEKDLTAATGITYFEKICVRKSAIFSSIKLNEGVFSQKLPTFLQSPPSYCKLQSNIQ